MPIIEIPIAKVDPNPFRIRSKNSDALSAASIRRLAKEIESNQYWETVFLARKNGGRYELAWGERRLRALRDHLGVKRLKLEVKEIADEEMLQLAAAENMSRASFSQEEEERLLMDFPRWPLSQIATTLGVSRQHIKDIWETLEVDQVAKESNHDSIQTKKSPPHHRKAAPGIVSYARSLFGDRFAKQIKDFGAVQRELYELRDYVDALRPNEDNEIAVQIDEDLRAGKIDPPTIVGVKRRVNEIKAYRRKKKKRQEKKKKIPPGLEEWACRWSGAFNGYSNQLSAVLKDQANLDYLSEFPSIAKGFIKAVGKLRSVLERIEARLPQ